MENEFTETLRRRDGESPQDHYKRLVVYRADFEAVFRKVKSEAAEAETQRELNRRNKRDEGGE